MTIPVTVPADYERPEPYADAADPDLAHAQGQVAAAPDTASGEPAPGRNSDDVRDDPAVQPSEADAGDDTVPAMAAPDGDDGQPAVNVRAQFNYGTMIGQLFEAVQRHSGAPLPRAWMAQELATYLPFGNQTQAAAMLQAHRVLVLTADRPGSGTWTAALHLLTTADGGSLTVRRIRREAGDGFSMDGLRGEKKTGWILDLRDAEETLPAGCELALELKQDHDLRKDESYLVALVNSSLWKRFGHNASGLALTPVPPDGVALFVRCLQAAGVPWGQKVAQDPYFKDLPLLPPGQVASWARTVAQTAADHQRHTGRELVEDGEDMTNVVKAAYNAVGGWMEQLTEWHSRSGRSSYDRNYVLLAAVFDGAPIPEVHNKIASLAVALGEKGEKAAPLTGQQGPGLIQLAHQIGADALPNGRLRFAGPGYAEAVVTYFWRDRPELINAFTAWTAQLCMELKEKEEGTRLAQRMAPWVLHHIQATRSTKLLNQVANDWSGQENLVPCAHDLLVTAGLDSTVGQLTRSALDRWIAHPDTKAPLLKTLAHVCQSLVPTHPERMLRRLGDLASSTKDGVAEAVGRAIDALWSDDDLRPRLHTTVVAWFASTQEPLRQAAANAFLNLALQRADGLPVLLREPGTPAAPWVIVGWRASLEADEPSALVHRAAYTWLDAAAGADQETRDQIMAVLVNAVHDTPTDDLRGQRFLNLVRLGEHWMLKGSALDQGARGQLRSVLQLRAQQADPHRTLADRRQEDAQGA
jgi:hypothetical protein